MQKARRHPELSGLRPLVSVQFQVLFHSPQWGPFHLSLTVLCSIGDSGVFSLTGWSRRIQTGFLVSRPTRVCLRKSSDFQLPGCHRLWLSFPEYLPNLMVCHLRGDPCVAHRHPATPIAQRTGPWHAIGLGSSPVARRYLGNHSCFLFLKLLRYFNSLRYPD